jgi:hypothetical protein
MSVPVSRSRNACAAESEPESVPLADPVQPEPAPEGESAEKDEAWAVLGTLKAEEKRFVLGVMRGETFEIAAQEAGWRDPLSVPRVLGRPRVRFALEQLAPLLEPKEATRILARYLVKGAIEQISSDPSAAASGHARRDLLALGGHTAVSRVEHLHASASDVIAAIEERKRQLDRKRTDVALPALPAAPEARLGSGAYVEAEVIDAGDRESVASRKRRK